MSSLCNLQKWKADFCNRESFVAPSLPLRLMLPIELRGEILQLLPERAIYWEKEKTLIVSDLHWGKTAHFRKNGIAIPVRAQNNDELRLAKLLRELKIERLIVAGDLFHSKNNREIEIFSHFRTHHQHLHIDLVIGNHDILGEAHYNGFQLEQHNDCLTVGPFCIAHEMTASEHFVIHGHVHPAVVLKSKGYKQPSVKLCCFAQDKQRMILPAFGKFTGTYLLAPENFQHLYLIAENSVIQWK